MSDLSLLDKANKFNLTNPSYYIAYGGDGTLLEAVRNHRDRTIIPIRNYGWCKNHNAKNIIDKLYKSCKSDILPVEYKKQYIFKQLLCNMSNTAGCSWSQGMLPSALALSEIVIRNHDPRQALRFNVYVNNSLYLENVMCDGVIISTNFGAHGYFKSVTRTLFYDGIGLAFIAPTYGINNLVLKPTDRIQLKPLRRAIADLTADTELREINLHDKFDISVGYSGRNDDVTIAGYDTFMCQECRRNRNSTIINDQYFID